MTRFRNRASPPSKFFDELSRDFGPVLQGITELGDRFQPLSESMGKFATVTGPFVRAVEPVIQAAEPFLMRWDTAEDLIAGGWVPNCTTPFGLVEECAGDTIKLHRLLLAHYRDNWREVRERLDAFVSFARHRRRGHGCSPDRPVGPSLPHRQHTGNSYRMRDHQNLMRSGPDRRRRKDGS